MSAARKYLGDDTATGRTPVDKIKAIWVASDDDNAVDEVRALLPDFFPNVEPENVAWISGGGKNGIVQTRSELEVRKSRTVCSGAMPPVRYYYTGRCFTPMQGLRVGSCRTRGPDRQIYLTIEL